MKRWMDVVILNLLLIVAIAGGVGLTLAPHFNPCKLIIPVLIVVVYNYAIRKPGHWKDALTERTPEQARNLTLLVLGLVVVAVIFGLIREGIVGAVGFGALAVVLSVSMYLWGKLESLYMHFAIHRWVAQTDKTPE